MTKRFFTSSLITALGLGLSLSAMSLEVSADSAPRFLKQAETAVKAGDSARVISTLTPRLNLLRKSTHRHRAHAALCNAHLKELDLTAAKLSCTEALDSHYADASDFNNMGVYYYLGEEYSKALTYFEQAARSDSNLNYEHNREAAIAAVDSR